jgi:hypothetical protein
MKRIIIAFGCLLAFQYAHSAVVPYTLSQIRYQVRYDIRDTTNTVNINQRFGDDVLNERINEVQDYVVRYTRALYGRVISTPIAEQQEYTLPDDCWTLDRVQFTGAGIPRLKGRTFSGLDNEIGSWEKTASGIPRYYYRRANVLGLYPKPSASTISSSSATIKIDYFQRATPMILDTDYPFNGDMALQDYATIIIEGVDVMCQNTTNETNTNMVQQYNADLANMKAWCLFRYSNDINENVQVNR